MASPLGPVLQLPTRRSNLDQPCLDASCSRHRSCKPNACLSAGAQACLPLDGVHILDQGPQTASHSWLRKYVMSRVASGSKGWLWQKHDESKSSHSMRQACRKNTRTRPRKHTTTHVHTDTNLSEFEDSPTTLTTAVALVKPVWSCIETRSERHDQNICLAALSGVGIAAKTETWKECLATCSLRVGGSTPQTSGTFMPISSQSFASLKRRVARKRLNSAMRTCCPLALVPSLLPLMPATPARALSCAGTRLALTGTERLETGTLLLFPAFFPSPRLLGRAARTECSRHRQAPRDYRKAAASLSLPRVASDICEGRDRCLACRRLV